MDHFGNRPGPKPARRLADDLRDNYKPRMPRGLADDAARLWRAVVPVLADAGQLTPLDIAGLEALATSYATMTSAARDLARDGVTHTDDRGVIRKHPSFQVWRDAQATFRSWAGEFGLTPLARKSVPAARGGELSLADLLRG